MRDLLLDKILIIPAILIAFTIHEYAHAKTADLLGDKTPKFQGRLTLNPIKHIDLMGFLMIILVGFGWAKPVQTNPNAYKNFHKDDLKVSLAGPVSNLITAVVFAIIWGICIKFVIPVSVNSQTAYELIMIFNVIMQNIIYINIMLFFFNLIPIPGLDGSHILRDLFPKFFYNIADTLYTYQVIILIIFIMPLIGGRSLASFVVGIPTEFIYKQLLNVAFMI